MFNSFIAQKCIKQQEGKIKEKKKVRLWNKRYKTQIRPTLVQKYSRRINGFAKKMQDEPAIINLQQHGRNDQILLRQFDSSLNVSKQNFMFKNSDDWKSIYTPLQRAERELIMKKYCSSSNDSLMALRNIWSQSKYNDLKVQYRLRQKEKDINPPMKYTNKNSELMLILPKIRDKYKKQRNKSQILPKQRKVSLEEKDQDLDMDLSAFNMSYYRKNPQAHIKTEKELIQQQQMKALAHKRLYFKSLIDLQQNVRTAKQRNQLKQILVKCGIFKPSSGKAYEQEEVDKFLELMKTKQA